MHKEKLIEKIEDTISKAVPGVVIYRKIVDGANEKYGDLRIRVHATNGKGIFRYWYLSYGVSILCPVCNWSIIPIECVWCGCKPIPRKLKKWCKKRRAVYIKNGS